MSILKIALTGGIACGKSSMGKLFKKIGVPTIDLDVIARKMVEPDTKGWSELVLEFGNKVLNADKTLNREFLRQQLFENSTNQRLIEQILHPKILQQMQLEVQMLSAKLVVVEVPLLIEQNLLPLFERAIVVDCSEENQLKRLLKRGNISPALGKKIISTQVGREQRLALIEQIPTDVVENNTTISFFEQKAANLAQKLLKL